MSKVAARHLERKACVYVRQSSIARGRWAGPTATARTRGTRPWYS